ncbi:MAG: asparagine synthase (glutamine-hydrolyzing) [Deltaproteobacteria bacterium]|nr:asparagine synthase (glutamine-hydrolyzing) [Deltaproteobacteria bacterium]
MCGIVGQIGSKPTELAPALDAIHHRGPDDRGTWRGRAGEQTVDLGFVRLAILDLSPAGHQPMPSADGSVWLTFNGEIYNYRELRDELRAAGHTFKSESDSETILYAYQQYGEAFVQRLRGMFALALWDAKREKLVLARDRLGIKPLLYSQHGGRLAWASEAKGLLKLGVPRTLNRDALHDYLRYLYVPPPKSIFAEIHRLEPGHMLVWERGQLRNERYWSITRAPEERDEATVIAQLRQLLEETVRQHLASDVPLGAFLSGGLDSSTLVALMARHTPGKVKTFCMTFGDGEELYDERQYARAVAQHFGTEHTEIPVKPNLVELLPQMVRHFDEPFGNPTALLVYLLSQETRKHVTVALAGDGGDEVFLGYPRYQGAWLASRYRVAPRMLRHALGDLSSLIHDSTRGNHSLRRAREFLSTGELPLEEMYENWIGYFTEAEIRTLLRQATAQTHSQLAPLFAEATGTEFVDRAAQVDLRSFLPGNLLRYTDAMSMAHSLEVRVPFCDHRLVEFLAALPASQKMPRLEMKALLKKAMAKELPPMVRERKKLGFNPPMGIWLNRELAPLVDEHLSPARLEREGFFDPGLVSEMMAAHRKGTRDFSLHIWSLLVFQTWLGLYQGA